MANFVLDKGYKASTTVAKFRGVTLTADDTVKQADAAGQRIFGVAQEAVDATDASGGKRIIDVRELGVTKAVCSAAITRGALIAVAADGRFLTAATTNAVVGVALTSTSTAGDWFDLELTKGSTVP